MNPAVAHCEQLVRDADKDRFLVTLFAPAQHRAALFALYAFNIEIARVNAAVTQVLAGEIRLQWWVEALEGKRPEEAPANPVASALIEAIARYRLPLDPFIDIIEASRADLYKTGDVEPALRASTALIELAARILNDGEDPDIAELARHAGIAWSSSDDERALRHLAEAGRLATTAPAAIMPALLPMVLVRSARAGKVLPQWRRQWLIWRAARDPRRIFR